MHSFYSVQIYCNVPLNYGHTMRKQESCLEKQIIQGTICQVHAGEEDYVRPRWTTSRRGQDPVEESVRMTEDRDKWRK